MALRRRSLLLLIATLAAPLPAAPAVAAIKHGVRIGILVSHEAAPYQEAVAGFRKHLAQCAPGATFEVYPLQGDGAKAGAALAQAKGSGLDLLFTVGSVATQAATRAALGVPIVGALILNAAELNDAPNATGVVLELPIETELQWLRRLLPEQRRVGLLYSPAQDPANIAAAVKTARAMGLTLLAQKVNSPMDLSDELDSLADRADVLFGLADPAVLNPQTAKPILLFSFRHSIPFVGLSRSWVKAGALYALDRDYADIGGQGGELACKLLQGARPASLPPVHPRKVVYAINLKTAQHMKLSIPEPLLRGAAEVIE